jgi:Zn-dependent protease
VPDLASGLVYYVVFLLSTTLHEAAHAWVALRGGDPTAYHGGQVSLDPRAHVRREPFGMVVLPLLSVVITGWPLGFASAPYDPQWALRHPKRAAWMALAGPGANLLLLVLAAAAIRVGVATGMFYAPQTVRFGSVIATDAGGIWPGLAFLLSAFFCMNLVLAALNLLPFPPLDGSAAIPLFLDHAAAVRYQGFLQQQRGLAIFGMLIAWRLFDVLYQPIFLLAVNVLHPGAGYH